MHAFRRYAVCIYIYNVSCCIIYVMYVCRYVRYMYNTSFVRLVCLCVMISVHSQFARV